MIFLLGGDGFVGTAYARLFESLGLDFVVINRGNYESHVGQGCDVLVNANGNSRKFLAAQDPKAEFDASVRSVVHSLDDFPSGAYVFLSSGDVYPDQSAPAATLEAQSIDARRQSRYGLHKHLAEQMVSALHPRPLIVRMGGFVGPGLRKNAIFDMLSDAPVWLAADSELQFISTDAAAELVWGLVCAGVAGQVVNLGARGVARIGDLHARLGSRSPFMADARTVRFEISTEKLERLSALPVPDTAAEIETFFQGLGR